MRLGIAVVLAASLCAAAAQAAPVDASREAHDVMFKELSRGRALFEGFETSVPPAGWSLDQTNVNETWHQDCGSHGTPYEGACFLSCLFDPPPAGQQQEEKLCFDYTLEAGDEYLCFYAFASTYWAVDPYQNYNLLVTIDDVVVWDYYNDNDGAVTWQWQHYCVDLSSYTVGQTISVCFIYDGFDGAQGAFDAISIGQAPDDLFPCCPFVGSCEWLPLNASPNDGTLVGCGAGTNPWHWATVSGVPSVNCYDGAVDNGWATNTSGNYPDSTGGALVFGPFSIASDCNCMELCHYYDFENGFDGGNVKVSTDGGSSWELVYPARGYDDILDSGVWIAECVAGEEVFTGSPGQFTLDCFNLSAYEGQDVHVGFFFGSDSGGEGHNGWCLTRIVFGDRSTPVEQTSWGSIKAMYR